MSPSICRFGTDLDYVYHIHPGLMAGLKTVIVMLALPVENGQKVVSYQFS